MEVTEARTELEQVSKNRFYLQCLSEDVDKLARLVYYKGTNYESVGSSQHDPATNEHLLAMLVDRKTELENETIRIVEAERNVVKKIHKLGETKPELAAILSSHYLNGKAYKTIAFEMCVGEDKIKHDGIEAVEYYSQL